MARDRTGQRTLTTASCPVGAGRGESTGERVGPVQETLCRSAGWKGGRDRLKREPYTGEDGKAPGRALILFFEGVYPHVLSWGRGALLALGTADTLDCPVRGKTFYLHFWRFPIRCQLF